MTKIDDWLVPLGATTTDLIVFGIKKWILVISPLAAKVLNFPIIKQLFDNYLTNRVNFLIKLGEKGIYKFLVNDLKEHEQKEFDEAVQNNIKSQLEGTEDEKRKAEEILVNTARKFGRWTKP